MPRKKTCLTSSKRAVVKRWDSDGVDPEAPTSMDVLLHWLNIPGNYQRWKTMSKHDVCEEIVTCMKDKGIEHRGTKSIWNKMHKLEKSFDCASSWLMVQGHFAEFQRGQLMKKDQNKLNKLCPYYDELSITFSRGSTQSVGQGHIGDKTLVCMQQTTKEDSDATDDEDWSSRSPHLPLKQRGVAPVKTRAHIDGNHRQRLLDFELASKKTQFEADAVCSVALNRKKMLDAGISQEEVDRLLPQ